jgi:hypothetical protein
MWRSIAQDALYTFLLENTVIFHMQKTQLSWDHCLVKLERQQISM